MINVGESFLIVLENLPTPGKEIVYLNKAYSSHHAENNLALNHLHDIPILPWTVSILGGY